MDTALKRNIYDCMTPVWSGRTDRELGEEYVVPDTMPDVGTVLSAEGVLVLRSKETEAGSVQLTAAVSLSVVYVPEDGTALRCLELELPAELRMDAPEADGDCVTAARMRLRAAEARAVNSRKLSLRAEVEAEACCYRRDSLSLAAGLAEPGFSHARVLETGVLLVTDVREKTFTVTDEYELPAGCGEEAGVLSRRVEALVEDVKYVSGKAVFRGRICTDLLLWDGNAGGAVPARYETEFSQIMEVGDGEDEAQPEVMLCLTGVYLDLPEFGAGGDGKVQAELHLAAQCVCRQRRNVRYLADIYSNRTPLLADRETRPYLRGVRGVTVRQTVTGRAEAAAEGEVIRASAAVRGIAQEDGAIRTSVSVRLLCRDGEGRYFPARCRLSAEFTPPEPVPGAVLDSVAVTVTDVYGPSLADDVRVTLRMDALAREMGELTCVTGVAEAPEGTDREQIPSFTLLRVPAGTDLWDLARRYHSTVEEIAAVNEGREEGLLLIPKAR